MSSDETDRVAALVGTIAAYRMALQASIKGHPYAHLLHGRIQMEREKGIAVLLGEPGPDAALRGFEEAMTEIAALLPTNGPSE